jgi:hypothetical protein
VSLMIDDNVLFISKRSLLLAFPQFCFLDYGLGPILLHRVLDGFLGAWGVFICFLEV